jgi:hypothetical protein
VLKKLQSRVLKFVARAISIVGVEMKFVSSCRFAACCAPREMPTSTATFKSRRFVLSTMQSNTFAAHGVISPDGRRACYFSFSGVREPLGEEIEFKLRLIISYLHLVTIGADYTAMSYPKYAVPSLYDGSSRRTTPVVRGTYRCDTFVLDLFGFTNIPSGYGSYFMWGDSRGISWPLDSVISGDPQSWKTNINLLFTATTMLPPSVFVRIKTF